MRWMTNNQPESLFKESEIEEEETPFLFLLPQMMMMARSPFIAFSRFSPLVPRKPPFSLPTRCFANQDKQPENHVGNLISEATQMLQTRGIPGPEREAEILLASVLKMRAAELRYKVVMEEKSWEVTEEITQEFRRFDAWLLPFLLFSSLDSLRPSCHFLSLPLLAF